MAEDASVVDGRELTSGGWLGAPQFLPAANGDDSVQLRVWFNGAGKFSVAFGQDGGALSASVWTTAEGLETVIAQCQRALDVSRGSQ
jgi:hypothetical protein